jgi:hypothetical protein
VLGRYDRTNSPEVERTFNSSRASSATPTRARAGISRRIIPAARDCSRPCPIRNTPCERGAVSSPTSFASRNSSMNDTRRDFLKTVRAGLASASPAPAASVHHAGGDERSRALTKDRSTSCSTRPAAGTRLT